MNKNAIEHARMSLDIVRNKVRRRTNRRRAVENLFLELRIIADHAHAPNTLFYRVDGMIDLACDAGIITQATAERCSDLLLAYSRRS